MSQPSLPAPTTPNPSLAIAEQVAMTLLDGTTPPRVMLAVLYWVRRAVRCSAQSAECRAAGFTDDAITLASKGRSYARFARKVAAGEPFEVCSDGVWWDLEKATLYGARH